MSAVQTAAPSPADVRAALDRTDRILRGHGGGVKLARVEGSEVWVDLVDACEACPIRSVTFALTVQPALRAIPGVEEVRSHQVQLPESSLERLSARSRKMTTEGM